MRDRLPVLIVGAGPTGLFMACELKRFNIPFRIIDKNTEATKGSNATWILPRSIELFDLAMIKRPVEKLGNRCSALHIHAENKIAFNIGLKKIDSRYKYILTLPQSDTEKLLNDHLTNQGIFIERGHELIDVTQDDDKVIAYIKNPQGMQEKLEVDYMIACDGAKSTIRDKAQLYFTGKDLTEQFVVADAQMDAFVSANEIHLYFQKNLLFAAFPLGAKKYRILANMHQSHPRKFFIEKEVKEIVSERASDNYTVHSVAWILPFWIHSEMVGNFRDRRIFLAGDAAHIHSPLGGQGMNTGFQDVFNLAWKIAAVVHNQAKPSLLDTYQLERHPVVKKVITLTESLTKTILFDDKIGKRIKLFYEKIKDNPAAEKKVAMQLCQLNVRYRHSPIIKYNSKLIKKKIKPGMHAPDVVFNADKKRLYNYLKGTQHTILFFTGTTPNNKIIKQFQLIQSKFSKEFKSVVKTHIISIKPEDDVIYDEKKMIHRTYRIKLPCVFIIRPDNVIAYFSRKILYKPIKRCLEEYLFP